jgi:AcrR family transcriptional regulator
MSMTMATLSRRARSRLRKTEQILDTALKLVVDKGLEALTIQGLARALDWSPGALYRYFPSKDALYAELQRRVINSYEETLSTALSSPGPDSGGEKVAPEKVAPVLVDLAMAALHYQAYSERHPGVFRLFAMTLGDPNPLLPDPEGGRVMAAVDQILLRITTLIEDGQVDGTLLPGSPSDRTLVFWATIQGILQLRKLARFSPERLDNARLLRRATTDLLVGWGAQPAAVNAAFEHAKKRLQAQL